MTAPVPPRLHGIVARDAPFAVVFRRGPSRQTAVLGWNLDTDEVSLGQWLMGRIFVRRCDLSPDGRHLIYFTMHNSRPADLDVCWTAVSRAPYLTALHIYGWDHAWNGGGLWLDNRTYWLNALGPCSDLPSAQLACGLRRSDAPPPEVTPAMGEDPVVYMPRLLRSGWTQIAGRGDGDQWAVFRRAVRKGWEVEKTFHVGLGTGPYGHSYWDTHRLTGPDGSTEIRADWLDIRHSTLLFGRDGALWRQRVHASGPGDPVLVRDLTDMRFERRTAPYEGLRSGEWPAAAMHRR